jgi:hypothetical protein
MSTLNSSVIWRIGRWLLVVVLVLSAGAIGFGLGSLREPKLRINAGIAEKMLSNGEDPLVWPDSLTVTFVGIAYGGRRVEFAETRFANMDEWADELQVPDEEFSRCFIIARGKTIVGIGQLSKPFDRIDVEPAVRFRIPLNEFKPVFTDQGRTIRVAFVRRQ